MGMPQVCQCGESSQASSARGNAGLEFRESFDSFDSLKPRDRSTWTRMIAGFFVGVLLALAFPGANLSVTAWIAPGLMLWICCSGSVFRIGYCVGLGRWIASIYWLLFIPFRWHAIAGFVALASVLAIFTALWCWVCLKLLKTPTGSLSERLSKTNKAQQILWPALCAAAWVAIEMITARLLTGFPWNILGASQYRLLALIQIASFSGVYGISFLLVLFSVACVSFFVSLRSTKPIAVTALLPMVALFAAIAYGSVVLARPHPVGQTIKIALVQPNIPQPAIWDPNEKTNRFLKLVEISKTALKSSPDLLVWPEAAMPDMFTRNRYTQDIVSGLVTSNKVWMVMGASDSRPKPGGAPDELQWANSAFLIDPMGELTSRYNKKHLVMFGEYMPLANIFPFLAKFRSGGAGLTAGNRNVVFTTSNPTAHFPVVICYEDMFAHEVRDRVTSETDFILNLTNDGWFGNSSVQWQHAINALFRAIENGIPLVRCTNNGLTCWIDSIGRLHEVYFPGSADIHIAGWKIAEVPLKDPNQRRTFYTRFGDVFGWICVAATIAALGARLLARKRPS